MSERLSKDLIIRDYCSRDIQIIHDLDRICFPADIAYSRSEMLFYVNHKDSITRIAEWNGEVVGFVVGRFVDATAAHVVTLDVIHAVRRLKVGTVLMAALHEEFRRRGAEVCFLEVDIANDAARRFYEGLHYKYTEVLPGYYNGRSDGLRMMLALVP